jgi:LytR cell envelope-related transcriptional attenuator
VIIVFVVAAIALVAVGTRPTVSGEAATTPTTSATTTTTTGQATAPTTTTTTIPNSSVKVVVANATQTNGLAAHYTAVLAAQGWAMQTPADSSATVQSSAVYYASATYQPAATSIATTLGLKPAAVLPLSSSVPVSAITGDDVVVVIGADLVAGA